MIAHGISQQDVVLNQQYVHASPPLLRACLAAACPITMMVSLGGVAERRQDF
ncbi:putative predicted protein [Rhizobium favelukesii]|uniref:Uncharacterized protein n=1 Tax=Rhizobium favelukesii TaxID=348824 RepID=W6RBL6_9HYPH|nr:putative predicted protein [Rhizobium favelukesii]